MMKRFLVTLLLPAMLLAGCKKNNHSSGSSGLPALPVPEANALNGITGGGTLPEDVTTYVGAFWRATQIGERVIKINAGTNAANLGSWSASVAWYDAKWNPAAGDGVVLAEGGSSASGIYTNNPGDAEDYKVSGVAATVSGTVASGEDIIFRIGLTKTFAAYNETTLPARYAVVVLTYGTPAKKQKLFLRQGEGADYVMRPGDKDGDGSNVGDSENRSFARKFSPYNLTASTMGNGGALLTDHPQLAVNGGVFVDYPTQGGAFFQATSTAAPRRAYHPVNPLGVITDWPVDEGPEFWNASTDETCPQNYRRPQDGNTATAHNADGWFDRRQIVNGQGEISESSSAVSATTKDVAYTGRLFFNPTATNASLFFPTAGTRYGGSNAGALFNTGLRGHYWSGSSPSTSAVWALFFYNSAYQSTGVRTYGFSVRCIRP